MIDTSDFVLGWQILYLYKKGISFEESMILVTYCWLITTGRIMYDELDLWVLSAEAGVLAEWKDVGENKTF